MKFCAAVSASSRVVHGSCSFLPDLNSFPCSDVPSPWIHFHSFSCRAQRWNLPSILRSSLAERNLIIFCTQYSVQAYYAPNPHIFIHVSFSKVIVPLHICFCCTWRGSNANNSYWPSDMSTDRSATLKPRTGEVNHTCQYYFLIFILFILIFKVMLTFS